MNLRNKLRPLTIGASISHSAGSTGTLGAFVTTPDGIGILSAGYVLAPTSQAKKGDSIHQPGSLDIEAVTPRTRIATLYDWIVLSQASSNIVDAGVALLTDEIEHLGNRIPLGLGCPVEGQILKEIADPVDVIGSRVGKIGRTTGYTEGVISGIEVSSLDVRYATARFTFDNGIQIETEETPFSQPGDAGAIVFTLDPVRAIGLLIASGLSGGRVRKTYACPIKLVLETLNVDLIGI